MKNTFIQPKILVPCFALLVGAVWVGVLRQPHGAGSATAQSAPKDALAGIPTSAGKSATDREIAKWTEAIKLSPKNTAGWVNLGDALMQKARETMDFSYYTHAERTYQKALELNPKSDDALVGMAWVNGGRHEFEKSIEWANKALATNSKNEMAFGLIGDADVEMGDYEAAYKHYQQMLDIRPDLASYSRGSHLLYLSGNVRKAVLVMQTAINAGGPFAENTAWCKAQGALMLLSSGYLVPAEKTLEAALKKSPENSHLLAAMGKTKIARKDYPAAIEFYKKAIAIVPMHDSLVALGDLYQLTGNKAEAEKQYALVETIHKLNKASGVKGDMQIAQFYADHDKNLPEALKEAEEEYKTRKNVFAADTLAWCYYKNARYQEAATLIEKAMSQHTPEAKFHYHAGMIFNKLGDSTNAKQQLYEALSLNPGFHPVYAAEAAQTLKELGGQVHTASVNSGSKFAR